MNAKAMIVLIAAVVSISGCISMMSDDSDAAAGDVSMGGSTYDSITSALNAAGTSATITLNNDITEKVEISTGKDVTIDLKNHTLTNSSGNTIVVENGATLSLTGSGTISNSNDSSSSCINVSAGGTLNISEDADVALSTQILNKGIVNIRGEVTLNKSIRTDSGADLYVYGKVVSDGGKIDNNGGTVHLDAYSDTLAATIDGTTTPIPDENNENIRYVNINTQVDDELDDNALHTALFRGTNVYTPGLTVIITLEGSTDPDNPNVYGLTTSRPDRIRATNMVIQSADGTYVTIDLSGSSQNGNAVSITGDGNVSCLTMSGIAFTAGTAGQVNFNFGVYPNFTFENCSFENINLAQSSGTSGTTVIRGCEFVCTGTQIGAYAVVINTGTVVVEGNTIDNYLSGVNINTHESGGEGITVSGNTISNLGADGDRGEAIQIAGPLAGKSVVVSDNKISNANVALQIYHNCGDSAQFFDVKDNSITDTPVGINYEADESDPPSGVQVVANSNYFSPDGGEGIEIVVTSDTGTDMSGQVTCDTFYTDPSMDSTNEDVAPTPSWDDDEDLPPFIPSQADGDDDTVTIVACAAAAAVAAIMAVFLIIDRKQ